MSTFKRYTEGGELHEGSASSVRLFGVQFLTLHSRRYPKRGGNGRRGRRPSRCAGNLYVRPFYRQDGRIIPHSPCRKQAGIAVCGKCHYQWAASPQRISLEGGRAETSKTSGSVAEARLRAMPLTRAWRAMSLTSAQWGICRHHTTFLPPNLCSSGGRCIHVGGKYRAYTGGGRRIHQYSRVLTPWHSSGRTPEKTCDLFIHHAVFFHGRHAAFPFCYPELALF